MSAPLTVTVPLVLTLEPGTQYISQDADGYWWGSMSEPKPDERLQQWGDGWSTYMIERGSPNPDGWRDTLKFVGEEERDPTP